MRHLFAVNPVSGKGKGIPTLVETIQRVCAEEGIEPEIFSKPDRAGMISFMRDAAKSGDPIRIYACGGDGTLFCAVNATFGYKNVQIAAVPCGSGNDFIRYFGTKEQLQDFRQHIHGTPHWIDAIQCGEEYAVNQCSVGFDAEVCAKRAMFKKIPLISGEFAYTLSLFYCLLRRFHNRLTIQLDDQKPMSDDFLFSLGGNSRWYGGGYMGCPKAEPDDGLLDCIVVRASFHRFKLMKLSRVYKKGQHLSWPETTFHQGKRMRILAERDAAVNVDGEVRHMREVLFQLREKAVCFVVPKSCTRKLNQVESKN